MADLQTLRDYRESHEPPLSFEGMGKRLGVARSTACKWEKKRVPAERVLDVEKKTGIPRHKLRPDIYPAPKSAEGARC